MGQLLSYYWNGMRPLYLSLFRTATLLS